MNKTALTLLSCSSSLALMLITTGIAKADSIVPVDVTFSAPPQAIPTASQETAPSQSVSPQYANVDPASDTIGDLAIAKFRCDCNACRVAVMQMLQTGQLTL